MYPIRILNLNLEPVTEIDNYNSFVFTQKYNDVGEFQITMNYKSSQAKELKINNLIMLGKNKYKTGIIKYKEIIIKDHEELITVKGYTLNTLLEQQIIIPKPNMTHQEEQGKAENVIKNFVRNNEISNLIKVVDNLNKGDDITWKSRYKNLNDEIKKIAKLSNLGYRIYPDLKESNLVFDVYEGKNLIANQEDNPPVIFSWEFENVKNQKYIESEIGYKNKVIIGGSGQGINRTILEVIDENIVTNLIESNNFNTKSNNFDDLKINTIFIDARDLKTESELKIRAKEKLNELNKIESFESEISLNGPFKYEKDWNIGDIVTIQNKKLNIKTNKRITQIKEVYENSKLKLNIVFGENKEDIITKIKREISSLEIDKYS